MKNLFSQSMDLICNSKDFELTLDKHRKVVSRYVKYLTIIYFAGLQVLTLYEYISPYVSIKFSITIFMGLLTLIIIGGKKISPEFFGCTLFHFLLIYLYIIQQYLTMNLFVLFIPYICENMAHSSKSKQVSIIMGGVYCLASLISCFISTEIQFENKVELLIFSLVTITLYISSLLILGHRYKEISANSKPAIILNIPDSDPSESEEFDQKTIMTSESENPDMIHEIDKNHFYANFSNEIRNSLNAINISLDYLLKALKDKSHLEILNNAKTAGKMAINYVNNMLDASKAKPDEIELCYLRAKPSEVLKQVLAITQDSIFKKGINLKAYIDKSMPSRFSMDSNRITQILLNIISNAIKFTEHGGTITIYNSYTESDQDLLHTFDNQDSQTYNPDSPKSNEWETPPSFSTRKSRTSITSECDLQTSEKATPHAKKVGVVKMKTMHELSEMHATLKKRFKLIDLSKLNTTSTSSLQKAQTYLASKGFLKYQVTDSGCGMSKSLLHTLVTDNKNLQLDIRDDKSTGISLAVCQMLIKKMGGSFDILSRPGKGTTFIFYIPVELGESPRVESGSMYIQKDKLRAIVVDDLAYNREIHKLILQREDVQVDLASNGKELIDLLYSKANDYYDFILTDIDMPEMDGITAAKEIRKNELSTGKKPIDIYFVSGNQEEVTYKSISSIHSSTAITKFIPKPMDISTVKKLIASYAKLLRKPMQINTKYLVPSIEEIPTPDRLPKRKSSVKVQKKLNGLLA